MQLKPHLAALATALGLAVQGCTPPPDAPVSRAIVYHTDMVGKAAQCTVPPTAVKDGATTEVTLVTGGGGWCGVGVRLGGNPYTAGLLTVPPKSGKVHVHTVGDDTRIDYTPTGPGVVADSFSVRLLPGNGVVAVSVNPQQAAAK